MRLDRLFVFLALLLPAQVAAKEIYLSCSMVERPGLPISVVMDDEKGVAFLKYEGRTLGARLALSPEEAGFSTDDNSMVWRINRMI